MLCVLIRVQLKQSILCVDEGSDTHLYQLACMLAHGIWVRGSRACIFFAQEHCALFHLGYGTRTHSTTTFMQPGQEGPTGLCAECTNSINLILVPKGVLIEKLDRTDQALHSFCSYQWQP